MNTTQHNSQDHQLPLPDFVIVQPRISYALESDNPQDDIWTGHTVKAHARDKECIYASSNTADVARWLTDNGYSRYDELTNRMFASHVDAIYCRVPDEEK